MTSAEKQIVKAYDELNISIEEIAEEHELSILEIKMVLNSYSSIYRKAMRSLENSNDNNSSAAEKKDLDFSEDDLEMANSVLRNVMQTTDDPHLQVRVAKYIRDDKKGRLDVVKEIGRIGVNLAAFNLSMRKMKMAMESGVNQVADSSSDQKVIEV